MMEGGFFHKVSVIDGGAGRKQDVEEFEIIAWFVSTDFSEPCIANDH
jgi:hypothetical protein